MLNGIGGWTVADARRRIGAPEFEAWKQFYLLFPFDDLHRFHRPAAAIAASWGGTKAYDNVIDFLAPEPIPPGMTQADWTTIKAFRSMGVAPPRKKDDHGHGI